jgi:multiple sugar transport system ATP-binding protein
MAHVVLRDLVKNYGDFVAVKGLNLEIRDGEFLVLLGPSGCGKTTTLRCISGLEIPSAGQILFDGVEVTRSRASERDIAFVFQLYALYPHKSVYQNLAFPLRAQGMRSRAVGQEIERVARMLGIGHLLAMKPRALSGGDMQRVALGRALVRRPRLFLLDEPIGTLDASFREEMRTELKKLHVDVGATTVYVTHDQIEAMSMGDRIAVMNQGELQQVGSPHDVYFNPRNLFVAGFIGSPGMNFLSCRRAGRTAEAISLRMQTDGAVLPVPLAGGAIAGGALAGGSGSEADLVLGVRPEDITLSAAERPGCIRATVFVVEKMGSKNIVDLKYGDEILRAKVNPSVRLSLNDTVYASFDTARIRLFDKASTRSLAAEAGPGDPVRAAREA